MQQRIAQTATSAGQGASGLEHYALRKRSDKHLKVQWARELSMKRQRKRVAVLRKKAKQQRRAAQAAQSATAHAPHDSAPQNAKPEAKRPALQERTSRNAKAQCVESICKRHKDQRAATLTNVRKQQRRDALAKRRSAALVDTTPSRAAGHMALSIEQTLEHGVSRAAGIDGSEQSKEDRAPAQQLDSVPNAQQHSYGQPASAVSPGHMRQNEAIAAYLLKHCGSDDAVLPFATSEWAAKVLPDFAETNAIQLDQSSKQKAYEEGHKLAKAAADNTTMLHNLDPSLECPKVCQDIRDRCWNLASGAALANATGEGAGCSTEAQFEAGCVPLMAMGAVKQRCHWIISERKHWRVIDEIAPGALGASLRSLTRHMPSVVKPCAFHMQFACINSSRQCIFAQ